MAGKVTGTITLGSTGDGDGFVLFAEQENVIDHRGGHPQVIACVGAGRTEAISRRVVSLIVEGAELSQIIAFTFTERATESLKAHIARRFAERSGQPSSTASARCSWGRSTPTAFDCFRITSPYSASTTFWTRTGSRPSCRSRWLSEPDPDGAPLSSQTNDVRVRSSRQMRGE